MNRKASWWKHVTVLAVLATGAACAGQTTDLRSAAVPQEEEAGLDLQATVAPAEPVTQSLDSDAVAMPPDPPLEAESPAEVGVEGVPDAASSDAPAAVDASSRSGCVPKPPGMVGWWPLDEQAGTTINDIAGGHNGTTIHVGGPAAIGAGGPTSIGGSFVGNSLQFAWNRWVEIPPAPDLNFGTGDFTIDAWIKYTQLPSLEGIVEKRDMTQNGYTLRIGTPFPTNQPRLQLIIGNTAYQGPFITAPVGSWVFVAATRTGNTVKLFVNNTPLTATSTGAVPMASSTNQFRIGYSSPSSSNLAIDEVELFNRALAPSEIQSIYNAGSAGKCKQPDKGMTWIHRTSNAQNGTISVGCSGCDAVNGDMVCSQALPVLCINKPTPVFQLPVGMNNSDINNRWAGGVVATTAPVAASTFTNSAAVNAYCQAQFGPGWRAAEFHDGWGWNFQAYGGTVSAPTVPSTRFWVHINDQTGGNCWQP